MRTLLAAVLVGVVGACTSSLPRYEGGVHVVQSGETLYTIAWRHGRDYRELAQWNRLANPDLIFVGQRIVLDPPPSRGSAPSGSAARRPEPVSRTAAAPVPAASPALPQDPAPAWRWPTRGAVASPFGSKEGLPNGVGIAGALGQPVVAAADGRVVYAGSGLIGYGQLVIIKHNDTYLSAYGYNRALRVSQGQLVRAGEQIAEMGTGPKQQPRLHFEIRRNGSPVDPLLHVRPGAGGLASNQ
jgi:lipoprotein NlpD